MNLLIWKREIAKTLVSFLKMFYFSRLFLPYSLLIELYKVLTLLFPDSFDYKDQLNWTRVCLGFPQLHYVQFGGFQQNINGQASGVWTRRTEDKRQGL